MRAYKCDACKKLFEDPNENKEIVDFDNPLMEDYRIARWNGIKWVGLDLCKDCQAKFQVFLFGEEDTDVKI